MLINYEGNHSTIMDQGDMDDSQTWDAPKSREPAQRPPRWHGLLQWHEWPTSPCFQSSPSLDLTEGTVYRPTNSTREGSKACKICVSARSCKDFIAQHASVFEAGDINCFFRGFGQGVSGLRCRGGPVCGKLRMGVCYAGHR